MFERKIINDPVFGFINIPKGLLYDVVRHPLLQRLNRIKQLGLSSVVYPGAQHTRFQHSLGAFYLMSEAIQQLATKGNFIFDSEAEAVEAAILMHDIGHGPFSHVLENTIVQGVSHEDISLMLMERINKEMNGQLTLAIQIFKDEYPKRFLHQLVSGQLDMDRLDPPLSLLQQHPRQHAAPSRRVHFPDLRKAHHLPTALRREQDHVPGKRLKPPPHLLQPGRIFVYQIRPPQTKFLRGLPPANLPKALHIFLHSSPEAQAVRLYQVLHSVPTKATRSPVLTTGFSRTPIT